MEILKIFIYISNLINVFKFKLYVREVEKVLEFNYSGNLKIHKDRSITLEGEDTYIIISKNMIDSNGELIYKFRKVTRFYATNIPLKTCKNFPDEMEILMIDDTLITDVDLNYVGNSIHFINTKLKTLRIKECNKENTEINDNGHLSLSGDISNLDTFAYIPSNSYIYNCEPFLLYNSMEKLSRYEIYKNGPRTKLFIEYYFKTTINKVTKMIHSPKSNPDEYFSKLYDLMRSDNKIYGIFEYYKEYKDIISWPENFFSDNYNESISKVSKYML